MGESRFRYISIELCNSCCPGHGYDADAGQHYNYFCDYDPQGGGYKNFKRLMDRLYRSGANVGNGSAAAAVREERETGRSVGGAYPAQKAQDSVRELQKWIERNPTANAGDRAAAENVMRDLRNALGRK